MSFGSTEFSPILMVGFNRRFSPFLTEAASLIAEGSQPVSIIVTVNAGFLSQDHWTRQPDVGGGRLIGEGCHFIDASRFLAASPIVAVQAVSLGDSAHSDSAMINLRFANGSIAAILYLTNGHPSVPKERIEVTSAGSYLRIDNFTSITRRGWNRPGSETTKRQNKGNEACIAAFVEAVRSGSPSPIPLEELIEVTKYTLLAQEHLMGYAE
jgi:predicted dehydrogenase